MERQELPQKLQSVAKGRPELAEWEVAALTQAADALKEQERLREALIGLVCWSREANDNQYKRLWGEKQISYERYCGCEAAHADLERELRRRLGALNPPAQGEEPRCERCKGTGRLIATRSGGSPATYDCPDCTEKPGEEGEADWEQRLADEARRQAEGAVRAECVSAIETAAHEATTAGGVVRIEAAFYAHDWDFKEIAPMLGRLATELENGTGKKREGESAAEGLSIWADWLEGSEDLQDTNRQLCVADLRRAIAVLDRSARDASEPTGGGDGELANERSEKGQDQ